MEVCKKEHKKIKKIINKNDNKDTKSILVKEEVLPSWFNQEQEKKTEGLEELNDVLKEFE